MLNNKAKEIFVIVFISFLLNIGAKRMKPSKRAKTINPAEKYLSNPGNKIAICRSISSTYFTSLYIIGGSSSSKKSGGTSKLNNSKPFTLSTVVLNSVILTLNITFSFPFFKTET